MITFDFFIIFALTRRLRVKRENIGRVLLSDKKHICAMESIKFNAIS